MLKSNLRKRGRVFPQIQWSQEKIDQSKALNTDIFRRSQKIFIREQPEFIKNHYNWFIAIEHNSEEYFIAQDEETAAINLLNKFPGAIPIIFKANETGACVTI